MKIDQYVSESDLKEKKKSIQSCILDTTEG